MASTTLMPGSLILPRPRLSRTIRKQDDPIMDTVAKSKIDKKPEEPLMFKWLEMPRLLFAWLYSWLCSELTNDLEEKEDDSGLSASEESRKYIINCVYCFVSLLLIWNYGCTIDALIVTCLKRVVCGERSLVDLVSDVGYEEFEGFASIGLLLLLWAGAFHIVANLLGRLFRPQKA